MSLILGDDFFGTSLTHNGSDVYDFDYYQSDNISASAIRKLVEAKVADSSPDKLKCALRSSGFTFVPNELFEGDHVRPLAKSSFSHNGKEVVKVDSIYSMGFKNIYGALKNEVSFFNSLHENVRMCHKLTPALGLTSRRNERVVWAFFEENDIDLIAHDNGNFVYGNQFQAKKTEDVLYYVLLAFYQAGFDPEVDKLVLSGRITEDSAKYQMLYNYVRHVDFAKVPNVKESGHVFYDLYLLSKYI